MAIHQIEQSATATSYGGAEAPFETSWHDSRIQYIILESELADSGITAGTILSAMQLLVGSEAPAMDISNFTIRLKHTSLDYVVADASNFIDSSGFTTVLSGYTVTVSSLTINSWSPQFSFLNPFTYNGGNLVIDITRDNTGWANGGSNQVITVPTTTARLRGSWSDSGTPYPHDQEPIDSTWTDRIIATQFISVSRNSNIPTNLSPANNTLVTTNSFTVSADVTSASSYNVEFQISDVLDFSNILNTFTDTTNSVNTFSATFSNLAQGNYYWRARGVEKATGSVSNWSAIRGIFVNTTATGRLSPDSIIAVTNMPTTPIANIQDDPDTPDANWLSPTSNTSAMNIRLGFPSPPSTLRTGAGLQTFKVWARRSATGSTSNPVMTIAVYENGVQKAVSGSLTVNSSTGVLFSFTWNSSLLTDPTGSNVEVYITGTQVGTGGSRTTVALGAVEWNYDCVAELQSSAPAPDTTPPSNVTNLSASPTLNSITLNWTNPTNTDFDYVEIYRDNVRIKDLFQGITYIDGGLSQGTQYLYKIVSVDKSGNKSTGVSSTFSTVSPDTTPPTEVSNLSETHASRTVALSWTNPTDSDFLKCKIYRGGVYIGQSTTGSYNDSGLSVSTAYQYKVTTVDTNDNESTGIVINVTTSPSNINPPMVTSISANHYTISNQSGIDRSVVTFTFDLDVLAWEVRVGGTSQGSGTLADSGGSVASGTPIQATIDYSEVSLGGNRVNIYGQNLDGTWTPYDNATAVTPSNITNLTSPMKFSDVVVLSWTGSVSTDVKDYIIYRDNVQIGTSTEETFSDSSVSASTSYVYKVVTRAVSGLTSTGVTINVTTSSSAKPQSSPSDTTKPNEVSALNYINLTDNSLTLTWTASTSNDVMDYVIYKDEVEIGLTTATSFNVEKLSAGTLYIFKVRTRDTAYNLSDGVTKNAITPNPSDTTAPSDVSGLAETHTSTTATLTWTNPVDSDFAYCKVYKNNVLVGNNITNHTFSESSLTASTTYTYKVTSVDLNGNESIGSTKSVTTSAPAGGGTVKAEYLSPNTEVGKVSWSQPLSYIQDNPTAYPTDTTEWSNDTANSLPPTVTLGFPIPTQNLSLGAGKQKLQVSYSKPHGYSNTFTIRVMESGVQIATMSYSPTTNEKGMLELPFDATLLNDRTGANIKAYISSSVFKSTTIGTTYWATDILSVRLELETTTVDTIAPPNTVSVDVNYYDYQEIDIFWTSVTSSNLSYYNVYYKEATQLEWSAWEQTGVNESFISGLSPATTYDFKVTSVGVNGNESNGTVFTWTTDTFR